MANGILWTESEDANLALRYLAGESLDAIATALRRTTSSVRTRVCTLGLLRRPRGGHRKKNVFRRGGESVGQSILSHPCFAR